MFGRLLHNRHTGQVAHRRETSYVPLVFLTFCIGMLLASVSWSSHAATRGDGQYSVNAVVTGPRPTAPAVITSPSSGQTFSANPVTVEGTCPAKSLVKVFTNGTLAGSMLCDANGRFKLPVDLLIGRNELTALPFNTLDQQGPESPVVTVTLSQPPGGFGFSTELLLESENFYRGTEPGRELSWPVTIIGGQAPYAVSMDWGDGKSDVATRTAPGAFVVKHTYEKSGGYLGSFPLIIRAADALGRTAYLQLTTIVNAQASAASAEEAGGGGKSGPNPLLLAWPLLAGAVMMIASFWMGERWEKRVMRRHLEALA